MHQRPDDGSKVQSTESPFIGMSRDGTRAAHGNQNSRNSSTAFNQRGDRCPCRNCHVSPNSIAPSRCIRANTTTARIAAFDAAAVKRFWTSRRHLIQRCFIGAWTISLPAAEDDDGGIYGKRPGVLVYSQAVRGAASGRRKLSSLIYPTVEVTS